MRTVTTVSPAKLPDGSWGAASHTPVKAGETVRVVTRSGTAWDARISEVLPGGLLRTVSAQSRPVGSAVATRRGGRCRASGCHSAAVRDGYCKQCHFDEYDC